MFEATPGDWGRKRQRVVLEQPKPKPEVRSPQIINNLDNLILKF